MTTIVRDEIDDLVDWQLQKPTRVWLNPMFEISPRGLSDAHRREGVFMGGARWSPEKGWGYVNYRGEYYENTEGDRPDYWSED